MYSCQILKLLTKKSPALKIELFLNTVLVLKLFFLNFPSEYRSNYAVKTMLDTNLIERTDGYIDTLGCDTQKNSTHYGKVIIQDYIDKVRYRCKI